MSMFVLYTVFLLTHPRYREYDKQIVNYSLMQAADFILENQNNDGSFSSYEKYTGYKWLEKLNPSGVFSKCSKIQIY